MSLSNKFDSNIYIEPDGSSWVRVFHHNNPQTYGVFVHHSDSEWNAGIYGTENKWFDLGILNDISGIWELMVKQATTSGGTEQKWRWTQAYNPLTTTAWTTAQPGTVTFNTSTGYSTSSWGGLWKMNSSSRMNIANSSSGNWFGAIGSWTVYQNGFPGYPNTTITTGYLDLYVRVDSLMEPISEKGLLLWLPLNGNLHNHGICQDLPVTNNGATISNTGKIGECYTFTNKTISVGPSQTFKSSFSAGASLAFWVRVSTSHNSYAQALVLGTVGTSWNDLKFGVDINANGNQIVAVSNGTNSTQCSSDVSIKDGVWHHIAATYKTGEIQVYLDGVLKKTAATSYVPAWNSLTTIGIGGNSSEVFKNGDAMNDVRVYNYALSAKEVREISKALVLHYKLDNQYVEGTTNLITTTDGLSNTCYNGATNKYSYGTSTDMYKTVTTWQGRSGTKVYMGTNGLSAYPYVYFDPFDSAGTNVRTLSFDYFPTLQNTLIPYSYNGAYNWNWKVNGVSGSATNTSSVTLTGIDVNQWNHIEVTAIKYDTSSTSRGVGYIRIGSANHTSNTNNFWFFANVQVENKDHATPYVGGPGLTRNTATTEFDCSGYDYDGTYCGTIAMSSNTARYNASLIFNGTDTAIQTPPLSSMITSLEYTIACWTYKTVIGSKGYQTIYGGPSGFELEARNAAETAPQYVAWNWGKPVAAYTFGEWHHFCFVHRSTGCKIYVDGIEVSAGSTANIPTGDYFIGAWKTSVQQNFEGQMSDFRIYATALSDSDVLELYQTSASIDRDGNYYTRELIEQ